MIKYIALDLDGTLLNDKKKILPGTAEYLKRISDNVTIILVSGRHLYEMSNYAKELELDRSATSIYIACDGQYIYSSDFNLLKSFPFLDLDDLKTIVGLEECQASIITNSSNYYINSRPQVINGLRNILKKGNDLRSVCINKRNLNLIGEPLEKVMVLVDSVKNLEQYVNRLSIDYTVHIIDRKYVEVKKREVSKWTALNYYFSENDISTEDVVYFGDDDNDMDCFQNLSHTVAMGNAIDKVKKVAEYIVDSNNEGGVVQGLRMYKETQI